MLKGDATWTYCPQSGAWYFEPTNRAKPPYMRQIVVEAIIDVDADGRLAGVEIVDVNVPEPAKLRSVKIDA